VLEAVLRRRLREPGDDEASEPESRASDNPAEEIFRLYGNAMFHAARRILPDDGEAEDAVMDALEKICARPDYFGGLLADERRLKLTVMRTVENAALDRWRRRKRIREREVLPSDTDENGSPSTEGTSDSAEEDYFTREEWERCDFGSLSRAVNALPEKYREILLLRYGEEYGNGEIAAMLGIPESTAASRLMRARNMLRKKLREGR